MQDKDKYIAIGDTIKNFANAIQDHANYIQSSVSKILEDERNG